MLRRPLLTAFAIGLLSATGFAPLDWWGVSLVCLALLLWLVREARMLGAPWYVTARMLANVALEGTVGMVPIAGDAFDVLFRANIRNVRMLRRWMDKQPR